MNLVFDEAPNTWVGLSPTHGIGLFARKNFDVGEIVVDYSKSYQTWIQESYYLLGGTVKDSHMFVGESEIHYRIIPDSSLFGKVNHSRTPNCLWKPKRKLLVAVDCIKSGDEITYDYRLEIGPIELKKFPPSWA